MANQNVNYTGRVEDETVRRPVTKKTTKNISKESEE